MKLSSINPMVNQANQNAYTRISGPRSRTTSNGVIFSNQEKWGAVAAPAAAGTVTATTVAMNPASSVIFTWASKIVPNYALYRFRRLRVCYTSTCPTTTLGDVVLGGFYDIHDALGWGAAANPQGNLTMVQGSSSGPTWGSTLCYDPKGLRSTIMYEADMQRLHARTPWFRSAPAVSTANAADYNQSVPLTMAFTCLWSGTANQLVGNLWIDYEIEAIHPQFPLGATAFALENSFVGTFDTRPLVENVPGSFPTISQVLTQNSTDDSDVSELGQLRRNHGTIDLTSLVI